jgi:hypothetical protein
MGAAGNDILAVLSLDAHQRNKKPPAVPRLRLATVAEVEASGIEPPTSALRTLRSPS